MAFKFDSNYFYIKNYYYLFFSARDRGYQEIKLITIAPDSGLEDI